MSETLVHRGDLVGHGNWVTAIATSSETPDSIVSASRGTQDGRLRTDEDERMVEDERMDEDGGWTRLHPCPILCLRPSAAVRIRIRIRAYALSATPLPCPPLPPARTRSDSAGRSHRNRLLTDKTLIVWTITRDESNFGIPRKSLHGCVPFGSPPSPPALGPES